jgi:hypothetical protein
MLTLVEALSLAGDRAKQNDDACGYLGARAWVIDGATDLHDAPLSGWASDAAWLAHVANAHLAGEAQLDLRQAVRAASTAARQAFDLQRQGRAYEAWQSPIASLLMIEETQAGVDGLDLGDCRAFALDANGAAFAIGGPTDAADAETTLAAKQTDADKPLLRREETIAMLRRMRGSINQPGAQWTFGLEPDCAARARAWTLALQRPAHLLLATDGLSALVDRYRAYDAAGLVGAALSLGLQELGRELRAIETADAGGALHPRFKRSDDATALLLRLE